MITTNQYGVSSAGWPEQIEQWNNGHGTRATEEIEEINRSSPKGSCSRGRDITAATVAVRPIATRRRR